MFYRDMEELNIAHFKRLTGVKREVSEQMLISSVRTAIENIIREVRIFRIIAEKYRNRRRRFALSFNQIEAIYNLNPCI